MTTSDFPRRRRISPIHLSLALFALFVCVSSSRAQDTGIITGLITDASGSPISGASLLLTNRETNVVTKVLSGADGLYVATPLNVGTYTIEVEGSGFKSRFATEFSFRCRTGCGSIFNWKSATSLNRWK